MDTGTIWWVALTVFGAAAIGGGFVLYRLSTRVGWRAVGLSAVAGGAAAVLVVLLTVPVRTSGTLSNSDKAPEPVTEMGVAVQLPTEAQAYIKDSKEDLATRLSIEVGDIELESITSPPETDGTYVAKLLSGGRVYEYHGRDGEAVFYSESLAPDEG